MAPSLISTITDEDHSASQQRLDDPHASYNTHLVHKHEPHLNHEITGLTANDLPYTNATEAHFEPGVAKANVAATGARPHGTTKEGWNEKHKHQTVSSSQPISLLDRPLLDSSTTTYANSHPRQVLQQHCAYWDPHNTGIITPLATYRGLRAWGWSLPLCLLATLIIHGGLSYPTLPHWLPDPFFRIYLGRIHRAKHGSDTMTYDNQGRFRPQAFEEIFANYDRGCKGGLTLGDLTNAWVGQRLVFDFFGWFAFLFECMFSICSSRRLALPGIVSYCALLMINRGRYVPPHLARGWHHAQGRH